MVRAARWADWTWAESRQRSPVDEKPMPLAISGGVEGYVIQSARDAYVSIATFRAARKRGILSRRRRRGGCIDVTRHLFKRWRTRVIRKIELDIGR